MSVTLWQGDCLELMKYIPDGSVDLVLTDPPYGTMRGAALDGWDNGTKTDWDKALPTNQMFEQISRVLRQNGKAVLFSQEPYTSKLITEAIPSLSFCYRAIWLKNNHANPLMAKSAMVSRYEDICVFSKPCPKHDYSGKNPNREYFKKVLEYIGFNSCKQVNEALGHRKAEHCFYVTEGKKKAIQEIDGKRDHTFRTGSTQFALCTESTYHELIDKFHIDKMDGFKTFKTLKDIEINYRDKLILDMTNKTPPVFNLWEGKKSKSNILEYAKDNDGYHPTQKPVLLLEDLIKTYSNEGDTILDFTMGSGSTGVACVNTNRNFIGIELDKGYFDIAKERIEKAQNESRID